MLIIVGVMMILLYGLWFMSLDTSRPEEGFLDYAPQCLKWTKKHGIWKWPPFSWLDTFYTFWTQIFLGIYWLVKDLF